MTRPALRPAGAYRRGRRPCGGCGAPLSPTGHSRPPHKPWQCRGCVMAEIREWQDESAREVWGLPAGQGELAL